MHRSAILAAALCLFASLAWADERRDNWHQWRGPDATGVAPTGNPPIKWDEKTNIQWKTAIPGRGTSTPIVWGDRVFLQTAVDTGKVADPKDIPKPDPKFEIRTDAPKNYFQFIVLCLDRKTGKIVWQKTAIEEVPHEGHHATHLMPRFRP